MHFSPIEFATGALRLCVWLALLTALFVPLERWFGQRPDVDDEARRVALE